MCLPVIYLKRSVAIDLLREISQKCSDKIIVDAVSLLPHKTPIEPFTDSPEGNFRIYIQTNLDSKSEKMIASILKEKNLEMLIGSHLVIIQDRSC